MYLVSFLDINNYAILRKVKEHGIDINPSFPTPS